MINIDIGNDTARAGTRRERDGQACGDHRVPLGSGIPTSERIRPFAILRSSGQSHTEAISQFEAISKLNKYWDISDFISMTVTPYKKISP